jgi:hypothetical protein
MRFQFEVRDETSSSVWSTQKGLRLLVTTRPGLAAAFMIRYLSLEKVQRCFASLNMTERNK